MVERNEIGTSAEQASIEALVLKRGVPADRTGIIIEALYKAFGKEDQPDQRIRELLLFQIEQHDFV